MRRKSLWLTVLILVLFVGAGSASLAVLLSHEPAFYARCAIPQGEQRAKLSSEFVTEFTSNLLGGVLDKRHWEARFSEEQINSYFEEDFITQGVKKDSFPDGISAPRIALEENRIRLGFHYGTGRLSTIVAIDLRAWIVGKEPNVIALEFQSLHAGAVPISAQWLLEGVTQIARKRDIEVTWYRHQAHPVVLLRFQAQRSTPTFQLQHLEIRQGMLRIAGRSLDTMPQAGSASTSSTETVVAAPKPVGDETTRPKELLPSK